MFILCNTLLPKDKAETLPADFDKTIEPIPVLDRNIEVDVAPIRLVASTDSNIVFRVLIFLSLF